MGYETRPDRIGDLELRRIIDHGLGWSAIAFISYGSIACDHFLGEFRTFAQEMTTIYCAEIITDEHPTLCSELEVTAVPTTIILYKGKKKWAYEGPYSHEALKNRVTEIVSKESEGNP